MKPAFLLPLMSIGLAGCLSSAPQSPVNWVIEFDRAKGPSVPAVSDVSLPLVHVMPVDVRPPYNVMRLTVLRSDGSVAQDGCNVFAASPAHLLAGVVVDALNAGGKCLATADRGYRVDDGRRVFVTVTRLALDCRAPGRREVLVELSLSVLNERRLLGSRRATASVPVVDGDLSRAFSTAFAQAVTAAFDASFDL